MSTHEDLLATIRYVRDRTGDPNAWQTGLTPTEVTAVVTSTTRSEQLDAILRKIRQRHSNLYYPAPPDREQGDAARAIADAEAALAHQNSATAQLDLQVVSAILNAHLKTVEGGESLHELQQEIEAAVRIRSDLDTPAGARDFQRFLIGKLKDIREVVATASLDAASKSALMAAWTSLYDASKGDRGDADDRGPASVGSGGAPARGAGQQPELPTRAEPDCLLDSLLLEDPGLLADDLQVPGGTSAAIPSASSTPSLPNLGGATMPGGGATPALVPGVSAPGGLPLSGLLRGVGDEPELTDFDERGQEVRDPADYEHSNEPDERRADDREGADEDAGLGKSESPPQAPTTVTLPNGETVTAAQSPARRGDQGGGQRHTDRRCVPTTGNCHPATGNRGRQPRRPRPDLSGRRRCVHRHALALGPSKALLDGQIQHISAVRGPNFLGWIHPAATATAPARTEAPTPTRPAAAR